VEEAVREGLTLDKDTRGVPGSPPLFDTILKKIEGATVFVPDLTFVGTRSNGEPTPNPNVLIEYGCALRHLEPVTQPVFTTALRWQHSGEWEARLHSGPDEAGNCGTRLVGSFAEFFDLSSQEA
jgi:hypothetical protein